ncbi:hypothetical protein EJ05DRAFT_484762 [Pseudovirgaria hyperparasitica]|uniref:protein-ribulosamine 3-kinase n=1 Tax=Pseudovirgaria hyperparasitica TaxID=470096 RepID=A0A6A6WCT6_9PEZI|nr:uncharacterized protein EJ05DRAFT_484762 [Pseudovirgaria hyperparasitica]KAF2759864.1 hypothetical protein EJ05DRAFT_484762 [Pseudovirgaria hyperparasitica]
MTVIPPEFTVAELKEEDKYEGREIDANIAASLPEGVDVIWVSTYGATHWSISTKIDTIVNGEEKSFFLKEYRDVNAEAMVKAEYESTAALYAISPQNVPEPIGYGSFASDAQRFFYVQVFCDMNEDLPEVDNFVTVLSKFHAKQSPDGQFGFHITTFQGNIPQNNSWTHTWEEYFARGLQDMIDRERSIQGSDPEMTELSAKLMSHVVPRLLRPMETAGKRIKPVLLHGDLWHGNVSIDNVSGDPIFYDAGSFYGHGEYDAGPWRATRYRFDKTHLRAYHKLVDISEPVEDHDDRNALYALKNDLLVSCCWKNTKSTRQLAINEMRRLVTKYPDGYEGYVASNSQPAAGA